VGLHAGPTTCGSKNQLGSYERPLVFSVVSLWEVAIKASLGRSDFQVNPLALPMGLPQEGFRVLTINDQG